MSRFDKFFKTDEKLSFFKKLSFLFIAAAAAPCMSVGAETLYVFYPSTMRPVLMQQKMIEACPGIQIKVFGRFADFETQVQADKPDAILTKYPVIQQIGGYSVSLKGSRKGEAEESNILLSVDEKVDAFKMEKGDCLVLYSDGITEAWGKDGKMFGKERLKEVIGQSGDRSVSEIHAAVTDALRPYDKSDDVTLFVMKRV